MQPRGKLWTLSSAQAELGDEYVLYLLTDQDEKPCVVVFPKEAVTSGAPSSTVEVRQHHISRMADSIAVLRVVSVGQRARGQ